MERRIRINFESALRGILKLFGPAGEAAEEWGIERRNRLKEAEHQTEVLSLLHWIAARRAEEKGRIYSDFIFPSHVLLTCRPDELLTWLLGDSFDWLPEREQRILLGIMLGYASVEAYARLRYDLIRDGDTYAYVLKPEDYFQDTVEFEKRLLEKTVHLFQIAPSHKIKLVVCSASSRPNLAYSNTVRRLREEGIYFDEKEAMMHLIDGGIMRNGRMFQVENYTGIPLVTENKAVTEQEKMTWDSLQTFLFDSN